MVKNKSKILFLMILFISTMLIISSSNWFGMWMGMEMNLMSFIPLISKSKNKKVSQAIMTYFLTQSMGSVILMFSVLINPLLFTDISVINEFIMILIMISIMIKVGAAPFHMWLPEMMANLGWLECLMLMTWQKIGPLIVLSNINPNNWFMYTSVVASAFVGSVGGLNQTSLRKIMAYSSINHLGWMMMFMSMNINWYKYLIIYSILMSMISIFFMKKNVFFMSQLNSSSPSLLEKFNYTIMFLSIGGLPPFLGFLPKWMVLQSMINSELYMMLITMMMFSLITLFYYIRLMTAYILNYSTMNKWMIYKEPSKFMMIMSLLINLTLPIFMITGFI
uniref:NADH-ubiquinone oxidoreductase chain 2 n=1 Tax=Cloresmus pulchellus TaxID=2575654 RepID=A0A4D6X0D2_9HEMI|nr:NADH dehydrogenase subunit 2 [Cloresmus pulchellus]QCI09313.1 NADH dehydrogenase subunit 2 [Cloresmus pulchellus]